jgi:hypothetical protein
MCRPPWFPRGTAWRERKPGTKRKGMPNKRRRRSVSTWDRKVHHDYLAEQRASLPHTREGRRLSEDCQSLADETKKFFFTAVNKHKVNALTSRESVCIGG